MTERDDERVDDLRRQLRALGYLDAGVDRFVLGGVTATSGPVWLAALASARVGLLGGVLLGPCAAIGIGARLPGLVAGVRDAIVIAIYLAVLFVIFITGMSFIVALAATTLARARDERFGRRAALVSRAGAWVTGLACLLYLTLWWRNANAGFGWSAPVWTAFALLVAVAVTLLLGHAQRIATLAVLAAAAGPSARLPPVKARSWRVVVAGGALAFAGAAALLVSTAAVENPTGPDHPPLSVISSGRALRVIAIDGFDPAMYDTFIADLASRVVVNRARLAPQDTSDPARAWTTIATGEPPEVHGVHGIETRRVAGIQGSVAAGRGTMARAIRTATDLVRLTRPSVASRDERRAKTIWEVAEDAGLRTAVVNWWATWPAPAGPGIVITDRAVLRLEQGGALDGEIAPASLYEPLRAAWPGIRERARTTAARLAATPDAGTAAVLRRSAELDATIIGLFDALPGPARDLDVVYLPGLDIAQHALLATAAGAASSPSVTAARVEALRGYYAFLRGIANGLLATPAERVSVVFVTQPGRVQIAAEGVLATFQATGIDVAASAHDAGMARVEDIAPTILNALGVPISRELAGTPAPILFTQTGRRYVGTYGKPFSRPTAREGKPLDQEMIDRLRSLGYVK